MVIIIEGGSWYFFAFFAMREGSCLCLFCVVFLWGEMCCNGCMRGQGLQNAACGLLEIHPGGVVDCFMTSAAFCRFFCR